MTKHKWQRNHMGGYSLMMDTPHGFLRGVADVFKAKKGDQWVARWLTHESLHINWRQGNAPTLREAMRLAQFMAGIHHV